MPNIKYVMNKFWRLKNDDEMSVACNSTETTDQNATFSLSPSISCTDTHPYRLSNNI